MKNILVTGGAGFIGSNFIRHILNIEPNVNLINLDALTYAGSLKNLNNLPNPNNHIFVKGNILDRKLVSRLLHEHSIDTIVHFAAESHVDRSINNPAQFIQTNVTGTLTLLEAAKKYWLVENTKFETPPRFHHISTDEVFGTLKPEDSPWTEVSPYKPNSPYAASKAASDHLVRSYGKTYGFPYTLSNSTNNYGPFQFPEKLIPLIILKAMKGETLPIYGDGQQIRDWVHVEDHCEAIHMILKKGEPGNSYNIGGGNQPTNLYIVELICDVLDELIPETANPTRKSLIRHIKDRPGHDRRYAMNNEKIKSELGWQPSKKLEDGLLDTVHWYLNQSEWVNSILNQPDYETWLDENYTSPKGRTA